MRVLVVCLAVLRDERGALDIDRPVSDPSIVSRDGKLETKAPWTIRYQPDSVLYMYSEAKLQDLGMERELQRTRSLTPGLARGGFQDWLKRQYPVLEKSAEDVAQEMQRNPSMWRMGYAHQEGLVAVNKFVDSMEELYTCTGILKLKRNAQGQLKVDTIHVFRTEHLEAFVRSIGIFMNMVTFSPVDGCKFVPGAATEIARAEAAEDLRPRPEVPKKECAPFTAALPAWLKLKDPNFQKAAKDYRRTDPDGERHAYWEIVHPLFAEQANQSTSTVFFTTLEQRGVPVDNFADLDQLLQATFVDLPKLLDKAARAGFGDLDRRIAAVTALSGMRDALTEQVLGDARAEGRWPLHAVFNSLARLSILERVWAAQDSPQEQKYVADGMQQLFGGPAGQETSLFDTFGMDKGESDFRRLCMLRVMFFG